MDTLPEAASVQIEVYRRMSPATRLRIGLELTAVSRSLLAAGVRRRHPEYTDAQIRQAFLRLWLGDSLYRKAYPEEPVLEP